MAKPKRLLYLTASRLSAHSLSRGHLSVDTSFERDDRGIAAFSAYLKGTRNLYSVRPEALAALRDDLDKLWERALMRYALVANNRKAGRR